MPSHTAAAAARTNADTPASASDTVYFGIVNGLDTHHVVPGQRLVEGDLAAQFGVGRNSVREALQRLAADAARRAAEGGPQATPGPDDQTVTPRDLERMLDKARDLGKTGSREAARDMLSNLQQMLENLSAAPRPGKPRDGASDAAADVMNKLTDLLERQQQLRVMGMHHEPALGTLDLLGTVGAFGIAQCKITIPGVFQAAFNNFSRALRGF